MFVNPIDLALKFTWTVLLAVLIAACEAGSGEGLDSNGNPVNTPSIPLADNIASIQANIFTPNCALSGCHSGAAPQQGLLLGPTASFSNIVSQPSTEVPTLNLIEPGNPDNSYLIRKVEGTASVGQQMPRNLPPLSNEKLQALRSWVSNGALVPTLTSIQSNVFTATCTQCHFGINPAGSLNLEQGQARSNLVGVQRPFDPEIRVVAGNADGSFLIDKLEGNNLGGSRGDRMPLTGPPYLPQDVINVIRDWIDAGAADN